MPTVAEMEFLTRAMDGLGGTLQRNRMMRQQKEESDLDRAMRLQMHGDDTALRKEDLGMRREDMADSKASRKLMLENQQAAGVATEKYRQAALVAKTDEERFKVLMDMNKEGALTEDGINAMSNAFNQKFNQAGLGVKLFRLPDSGAKEPKSWTHPKTGKEFVYMGKDLQSAETPYSDVVEESSTPEGTRKITRKVRPGDLEKSMQVEKENASLDQQDKTGPNEEQQKQMEEILSRPGIPAGGGPARPAASDRVTVISPDGKRGTIPRSQLKDALAKGFKQTQ